LGKGLTTAHIQAPTGTTSENLSTKKHAELDFPSPQEELCFKHPEQISSKAVWYIGVSPVDIQLRISTLRRGRDKEKPLSEGTACKLEIRGKSTEHSLIELRGNPLLFITWKKFGLYMCVYTYIIYFYFFLFPFYCCYLSTFSIVEISIGLVYSLSKFI
jgi:hypothetical protein